MTRIAEALARVAGPVLVTGHTDNTADAQPALPVELAPVGRTRPHRAPPDRRSGRRAARPCASKAAPTASPACPTTALPIKALNRRVEITLVTAKQGALNGAARHTAGSRASRHSSLSPP
jgi:hypothetical protein